MIAVPNPKCKKCYGTGRIGYIPLPTTDRQGKPLRQSIPCKCVELKPDPPKEVQPLGRS